MSGHRHTIVCTYSRPWRRMFRRTYEIRCWTCELLIHEGRWLHYEDLARLIWNRTTRHG